MRAFVDRFYYLGQCYEIADQAGDFDRVIEIEAQLNQAIRECGEMGLDPVPIYSSVDGRNKIRAQRGQKLLTL